MVRHIHQLIGRTLVDIKGEIGGEEIVFSVDNGEVYRLYHDQDCCEWVSIDDICGDLQDLVGSPILMAEEVSYQQENPPNTELKGTDSFTWTFYKFRTMKGSVTIRWYGTSNGYYSESVDFEKVV